MEIAIFWQKAVPRRKRGLCMYVAVQYLVIGSVLGAVHILRKHILGSPNTLGGVVSTW